MNTKNISRGLVSKLQRVLLAMLVLVVTFSLLPTGKAHAWMSSNSYRKPGVVSVPTVRIGDTVVYPTEVGVPVYALRFDSNSRNIYAYRSPATSGDQTVIAIYTFQGWSGSGWVKMAEQVSTGTIRAGQSYVAFPPLDLKGIQNFKLGYYYRVTWTVTWGSPTGIVLGGTQVVSNLKTDYNCVTTRYVCIPYTGSVLIR